MPSVLDAIIIKHKNGELVAKIPSVEILADTYDTDLPDANLTFKEIINNLQEKTKQLFYAKDPALSLPASNAFNNCNGRWAEYVFAAYVWNALAEINRQNTQYNYVFVKLPMNSSSSNIWTSLLAPTFEEELNRFARDSSDPEIASSGHERFLLCSSNPDAIILKYPKGNCGTFPLSPETDITNLTISVQNNLDSFFTLLRSTVNPYDNLIALLSVKTSTRPDRRYQFVHEGDNVKAILLYLINRGIDRRLNQGFLQNKYYCFSFSSLAEPDFNAMETAMTACLSVPSMPPVWAVDKIFACLSPCQIAEHIRTILN